LEVGPVIFFLVKGGLNMKDKRSLHLKVQELCDCYATTDPLKEMSVIKEDKNEDEAGLKWLALAALHGINANAKKISFARSKDGKAKVTAEYRKSELPSPGPDVGDKIIEAVRGITHLEGEKAKSALALGIRESSIEVNIKVKREADGEKVTLEFPK
jgi:hypothetical protein